MQFFKKLTTKQWGALQVGMVLIFLATHLYSLVLLPVFADESIYIRWSQLIMDDAARYLFFPLNDGKTPVFIWTMVPFLSIIKNQLLAGRLVSVLAGLIQMFVMKELAKSFGARRLGQLTAMLATTVLPFWFLYHRMALMDSMMTLWLSLSLLSLKKLVDTIDATKMTTSRKKAAMYLISSGVFFGLALLTKLPALFFGPVFVLISIFPFSSPGSENQVEPQPLQDETHAAWLQVQIRKVILIGLAGMIGCAMFFSLKIEPAFGQLFSRGKDFTFSTQDLLRGDWRNSVRNVPRFLGWLSFYFSPAIFVIFFSGILSKKHRIQSMFLLLGAMFFAAPFVIFGKVVYPRYLLPSSIFITILMSLVVDTIFEEKIWQRYIAFGSTALIFIWSTYCLYFSLFDADHTPFVPLDREQYLTEWSSGHGITQSIAIIQEKAKDGRVVVATEGFFGTLPDGILLNLHNQDVRNIEVFGIGAPVRHIPDEFFEKAKHAKTSLLLVNSHRMDVKDQRFEKIASFPRPYGAPSFDVYEFKP